MEQQMAMPTQCNKCDEYFDLSYDLKPDLEPEMSVEFQEGDGEKGNFCWNCRI